MNLPVYAELQHFNLFRRCKSLTPTLTFQVRTWDMKIQPQSSPNAESVSFEIPALNSPCYYYFSDMELEVICRMESDEGKDILNDSDFTVVNNIGQSMFSDLKFFVADQQVTNFSNSLYPTFCYVQNLLNNDKAKAEERHVHPGLHS